MNLYYILTSTKFCTSYISVLKKLSYFWYHFFRRHFQIASVFICTKYSRAVLSADSFICKQSNGFLAFAEMTRVSRKMTSSL